MTDFLALVDRLIAAGRLICPVCGKEWYAHKKIIEALT